MTKVIGMLVALAMFCAMPAVAFAGDTTSSNNEQNAGVEQGAAGGDSTANGGSGGDGDGDDGSGGDGGDAGSGDGGDAGNQSCIIQQNAGDDANAECDQSQNFGGDTFVSGEGDGDDVSDEDDNEGEGGGDFDDDDEVTSGGTGGGVDSVTLAQTGFDAWVLALIGGLSLAGGLGLLAAQRRGRLNA